MDVEKVKEFVQKKIHKKPTGPKDNLKDRSVKWSALRVLKWHHIMFGNKAAQVLQ